MSDTSHEQNRRAWNLAIGAHLAHDGGMADFLRGGGSTLFPEEVSLLGFLRGKSVVHLQCNAGADTLSLARLGARAHGVDIADAGIARARALAEETGLGATFERAEVLGWMEATEHRFDVAFLSYGALSWVSDLSRWAAGVHRILRPGGRLVLVEFHPVAYLFDEGFTLRYPYSTHGQPIVEASGIGDYIAEAGGALSPEGFRPTSEPFVNPEPSHFFAWGLGDLVSAVLGAGLRLEHLHEYEYSNGCRLFPGLVERPGRRWALPEGVPAFPLMVSLAAAKPER